uniref:U1 small nuclear ribonucleoprotein 70 kDa n=1 Tax=Timema douglasi TaxID=61478 RepID=A0A7R8VJC1_TIMDO|nr:unnamed protein product [Timema douglasi]
MGKTLRLAGGSDRTILAKSVNWRAILLKKEYVLRINVVEQGDVTCAQTGLSPTLFKQSTVEYRTGRSRKEISSRPCYSSNTGPVQWRDKERPDDRSWSLAKVDQLPVRKEKSLPLTEDEELIDSTITSDDSFFRVQTTEIKIGNIRIEIKCVTRVPANITPARVLPRQTLSTAGQDRCSSSLQSSSRASPPSPHQQDRVPWSLREDRDRRGDELRGFSRGRETSSGASVGEERRATGLQQGKRDEQRGFSRGRKTSDGASAREERRATGLQQGKRDERRGFSRGRETSDGASAGEERRATGLQQGKRDQRRGFSRGRETSDEASLHSIKMTQFLPPNLLALFAPRDPIPYLPPPDKLPHEKKNRGYIGIGEFLKCFEDPKDTPPPTRVETREERLERRRRERAEQVAYKLEQEIAVWDPHSLPLATADPFKTLFVARINFDTSESKLRREFEVYGPIKKIVVTHNTVNGKPRGYAFIEYEHERDMHCKKMIVKS